MEPIRILHVIGSLNSGGSQALIMNIYRNIDRTKVQFDFIVDKKDEMFYEKEIKSLGGRVFILKNIKKCTLIEFCKQWKEFFSRHEEYKIVHGHVRSVAAIYLKIARNYGMVTIAHSHSTCSRGTKIEQYIKNIMQLPIRYIANYMFACSDESGKWLFGKRATTKKNYKIIRNAIDIEKYTFNSFKRNEMRKKLGLGDKFVIGHVGTFTYPKNHKFLIDIFYKVQMKYKKSVLVLIGDGKLRPQIEKQINDLGIKDKVILTGVVSNVNDYMQAMDLFMFPSIFEGLGMAVIEAQASGLKCMVSDKIPREAFITKLIKKISLRESYNMWVDESLRYVDGYKRGDTFLEIKSMGYDIKNISMWFEKFYSGGFNR